MKAKETLARVKTVLNKGEVALRIPKGVYFGGEHLIDPSYKSGGVVIE